MADPATPPRARSHHSARTKARKRALDVLFESELRSRDALVTLDERTVESDPPVRAFSADIVRGVVRHRDAIDTRITAASTSGWSLARMPRVDRNLARIAIWELDHTATPPEAVIAEAVGLAGELSTDDSPTFLNGLLSRAAELRTQPEQT